MDLNACYEVLDLEPGASPADIKAAYHDLVKVWHPDRFSHESPRLQNRAEEQLKKINGAYRQIVQHLSDNPAASSRAGHDTTRQGRESRQGTGRSSAHGQEHTQDQRRRPPPPPRPSTESQEGDTEQPSRGFRTYADIPFFRRQWFFWLFWLFCAPISLAILVSGDVYYVRGGEVRTFGVANRIVAGVIGLFWLWQMLPNTLRSFLILIL